MGIAAHGWVKQNPEMLPEEEETFVGQIKVPGSISRHVSTFSEVFIFQ
jgi:hypothetical protein